MEDGKRQSRLAGPCFGPGPGKFDLAGSVLSASLRSLSVPRDILFCRLQRLRPTLSSPAHPFFCERSLLHLQASEHHVDGAESQPQHSTGEVNPIDSWAEATESSRQVPRPSVSSTSATGQGSSNPAQESEAASAPPATEQDSSRPTDDQIIAQENEIRCTADYSALQVLHLLD